MNSVLKVHENENMHGMAKEKQRLFLFWKQDVEYQYNDIQNADFCSCPYNV